MEHERCHFESWLTPRSLTSFLNFLEISLNDFKILPYYALCEVNKFRIALHTNQMKETRPCLDHSRFPAIFEHSPCSFPSSCYSKPFIHYEVIIIYTKCGTRAYANCIVVRPM